METIFDLPVIAFRNIPESIVAKLHDVTSQATGYAAVTAATTTGNNNTNQSSSSSSSSPLAILDGTKIVSRIHLGSAIRKALMNALPNNNNNNTSTVTNNNNTNNNVLSATQLIENSSRAVSPRRLASPTRKNKSPTKSTTTDESKDEKDGNNKKPNNNKQRIASQIVFALNTSKTNAVKNFALSTSSSSSGDSTTASQVQQHPCVVIIFDVEISPAEAWRWVRSSGASGYVISLDNLQATVDSQAVCGIYSLDPRSELSSSLSMSSSLGGGGSKASNSNFPNKVATRDISWLERQIVSKIATTGV